MLARLAAILGLTGCVPGEVWDEKMDPDGDEYRADTGEYDCNNDSSSIHPGAVEVCDSSDNDCDGAVNETEFVVYLDGDGDGHGNRENPGDVCTCAVPGSCTADADDCDDAHADVYPGAVETCNSKDDDCDGAIDDEDSGVDHSTYSTYFEDGDGDGQGNPESWIQQCAQSEGYVTSADDCLDTIAASLSASSELVWRVEGAQSYSGFGSSIGVGDLDGDDCVDMVAAAPGQQNGSGDATGAVAVLANVEASSDCLSMGDWDATDKIFGPDDGGTYTSFGAALGVGDLDLDGYPDLMIGAEGYSMVRADQGAAFLFYGPVSETATWSGVPSAIGLSTYATYLGSSIAVQEASDMSDPFVVIGAGGYPDSSNGAAWILDDASLASSPTIGGGVGALWTSSVDAAAGAKLALGDLNGDGLAELAIGAPDYSATSDEGAVYLINGDGLRDGGILADAWFKLIGTTASEHLGDALVIADLDGDGGGDLAVGAAGTLDPNTAGGRVYGLLSPDEYADLNAADFTINCPKDDENCTDASLGIAVAPLPDFGSPGIVGLAVGAPTYGASSDGGELASVVSVFLGPMSGSFELLDGCFVVAGESATDAFGSSLLGGSPATDGGLIQLVVGAPSHENSGGNTVGAIYTLSPESPSTQ